MYKLGILKSWNVGTQKILKNKYIYWLLYLIWRMILYIESKNFNENLVELTLQGIIISLYSFLPTLQLTFGHSIHKFKSQFCLAKSLGAEILCLKGQI